MLGRGAKNVVYEKMGKDKYSSETPFKQIKRVYVDRPKKMIGDAVVSLAKGIAKVDKKVRTKFGLPYGSSK
jgi:hypothetical protein